MTPRDMLFYEKNICLKDQERRRRKDHLENCILCTDDLTVFE
jgi:hypothetical protein